MKKMDRRPPRSDAAPGTIAETGGVLRLAPDVGFTKCRSTICVVSASLANKRTHSHIAVLVGASSIPI